MEDIRDLIRIINVNNEIWAYFKGDDDDQARLLENDNYKISEIIDINLPEELNDFVISLYLYNLNRDMYTYQYNQAMAEYMADPSLQRPESQEPVMDDDIRAHLHNCPLTIDDLLKCVVHFEDEEGALVRLYKAIYV
jgi:hypothetical protein